MRSSVIVQAALALVFAAGATAGSAQAQTEAQRQAYVLSEIDPKDRDAYMDYLRNVLPIIEQYGGQVLINPFEPKTVTEGRALEGNLAMIVFPSAQARDAFWGSPEYQPWKKAREANATSRIIHVN